MAYQLDTPVSIVAGVTYTPLTVHRGKASKDKTVWTISLPAEIDCFRRAHAEGWLSISNGWGIRQLPNGRLAKLGENAHSEELKLAKFVDPVLDDSWHGYPADYQRRPQDRPAMTILQAWRLGGIIYKHDMAKIARGRPCNL